MYEQNLIVKSHDRLVLSTYKLGLVEALLKETLRMLDAEAPPTDVRAHVRTALDVALWDPPRR
jgi:hypothetical protein